jgi:glycosyltransferase involved in cell wall biosynthesis
MMLEVENEIIWNEITLPEAKPFVVVGIPAYNEETMIARIVIKAQKYVDAVLVCDDGSSDTTGAIAERLGADVVRHRKNLGYGASIKSLFKRARELNADVLVTLDADGQHNPEEIPDIVEPITQGLADMVIGSRFIEKHGTKEMPFYRKLGAQLITKLVNGSSKNGISDAQSGFRAYNRRALERLSPFEGGMGASVEILLKANKHGLKIFEVPSSCKYQGCNVATSTEHPLTHGISVLISIVRYIVEEKPLIVLGMPGLLFLFMGLGFGIWMLQIYAIAHTVVTNIALASVAFVLIGFFMLSTAVTLYAIKRMASEIGKHLPPKIKE